MGCGGVRVFGHRTEPLGLSAGLSSRLMAPPDPSRSASGSPKEGASSMPRESQGEFGTGGEGPGTATSELLALLGCSSLRSCQLAEAKIGLMRLMVMLPGLSRGTLLDRVLPALLSQVADTCAPVRTWCLRSLSRLLNRLLHLAPADEEVLLLEYLLPTLSMVPYDPEEGPRAALAAVLASIARSAKALTRRPENRGTEDEDQAKEDEVKGPARPPQGPVLDAVRRHVNEMLASARCTSWTRLAVLLALLLDPDPGANPAEGRSRGGPGPPLGAGEDVLALAISFLNDRQSWQLRAAFFTHIGKSLPAASEPFLVPLLEEQLSPPQPAAAGQGPGPSPGQGPGGAQVLSAALTCLLDLLHRASHAHDSRRRDGVGLIAALCIAAGGAETPLRDTPAAACGAAGVAPVPAGAAGGVPAARSCDRAPAEGRCVRLPAPTAAPGGGPAHPRPCSRRGGAPACAMVAGIAADPPVPAHQPRQRPQGPHPRSSWAGDPFGGAGPSQPKCRISSRGQAQRGGAGRAQPGGLRQVPGCVAPHHGQWRHVEAGRLAQRVFGLRCTGRQGPAPASVGRLASLPPAAASGGNGAPSHWADVKIPTGQGVDAGPAGPVAAACGRTTLPAGPRLWISSTCSGGERVQPSILFRAAGRRIVNSACACASSA